MSDLPRKVCVISRKTPKCVVKNLSAPLIITFQLQESPDMFGEKEADVSDSQTKKTRNELVSYYRSPSEVTKVFSF